jgi:hypothetical protein
MDKEFRFNDGGEQEDGSKRSGYKGQEPDNRVNQRIGSLKQRLTSWRLPAFRWETDPCTY